jgi:ATP-dependent DNA helicase RecG
VNYLDLLKDITYVKGVGTNRADLLHKLGIYNLYDLITYFPREHEDRSIPKKISEVTDGEEVLIEAVCVAKMSEHRVRKNLTICNLIVRDETSICYITWYNQTYLKTKFVVGAKYRFFGKASVKYGKVELNSPVFDIYGQTKNTGKIIPIYPLTYNLSRYNY